ncbi:hypothetical protein [Streptomyces sp. NPDC060194]|uniref:hypothetical protein n=1 Tax=Streptomyces sp. NPDC060194 TaxID=3347069 RepID=UPI003654D292
MCPSPLPYGPPFSGTHSGPRPFLRRGAGRHPRATPDLLEHLLAAPDPQVAEEAAAHPALPPSRRDDLLTAAGL